MNRKLTRQLYGLTYRVTGNNLEGITHEEALAALDPGGNCINWVLGHMVVSRDELLEHLGAEGVCSDELRERYSRGSAAITSESDAEPLDRLLGFYEESQKRIVAAIGDVEDEEEAERHLLTYHFHDTYHAGQLGLLRRFVRREGAIT